MTTVDAERVQMALDALRSGQPVLVIEDDNGQGTGTLMAAAETVTGEIIGFMDRYGGGLTCLPMEAARLERLGASPLSPFDARLAAGSADSAGPAGGGATAADWEGGATAAGRAHTARLAARPEAKPDDFLSPGHVFPLGTVKGGVLRRPSHGEAAVDLAALAGFEPVAVICAIIRDGTVASAGAVRDLAASHGLAVLPISCLIRYRSQREKLVHRVARVNLPTRRDGFELIAYDEVLTDATHVALVKGQVAGDEPVLVRVHSECLTGDIFGSLRCDCGEQLERALDLISAEGRGLLLYMRQEGRGIGLSNKLKAYELQEEGLDTVEANLALGLPPDARDYGTGAQILADLGITRIRLLTNNPRKFTGLAGYGLEISEVVPLLTEPNAANSGYLTTKKTKLGHLL